MMRFMALALIVGAAHAACGPEGCSSNSLNETRAEIAKVISGLGDLPAPREQLTFRSSLKTTTAKGSPGVSQEALLAAVSEAVSAITAKAGFTDDSVELKSVTVEVTKTPVTTAAPEPEDDVEQIKKASNAAAAASADAEAQKTAALGNANEATKKAISASAKTEASVEAFLEITGYSFKDRFMKYNMGLDKKDMGTMGQTVNGDPAIKAAFRELMMDKATIEDKIKHGTEAVQTFFKELNEKMGGASSGSGSSASSSSASGSGSGSSTPVLTPPKKPVSTANTGASTKPATPGSSGSGSSAPVLTPPKTPVSTANTGASTKPAVVTAAPEVVTAAPAVVTAAPITAAPTAVVEMVETTTTFIIQVEALEMLSSSFVETLTSGVKGGDFDKYTMKFYDAATDTHLHVAAALVGSVQHKAIEDGTMSCKEHATSTVAAAQKKEVEDAAAARDASLAQAKDNRATADKLSKIAHANATKPLRDLVVKATTREQAGASILVKKTAGLADAANAVFQSETLVNKTRDDAALAMQKADDARDLAFSASNSTFRLAESQARTVFDGIKAEATAAFDAAVGACKDAQADVRSMAKEHRGNLANVADLTTKVLSCAEPKTAAGQVALLQVNEAKKTARCHRLRAELHQETVLAELSLTSTRSLRGIDAKKPVSTANTGASTKPAVVAAETTTVAPWKVTANGDTTAKSVIADARAALAGEVGIMDAEMAECRKVNKAMLDKEVKRAQVVYSSEVAEANAAKVVEENVASAIRTRTAKAQVAPKRDAAEALAKTAAAHDVASQEAAQATAELEAAQLQKKDSQVAEAVGAENADIALAQALSRHGTAYKKAAATFAASHASAVEAATSNAKGKVADAERKCESDSSLMRVALLMKAKGIGLTSKIDHLKDWQEPTPVHCVVSAWKQGVCSTTCGLGERTDTRAVVTKANKYGLPCPKLEKQIECNMMACPKDCAMSDWTDGKCSVTCGEGSQSRFRTVLSQAVGGGKACSAADGDTVKETKLTKCTMPACTAKVVA